MGKPGIVRADSSLPTVSVQLVLRLNKKKPRKEQRQPEQRGQGVLIQSMATESGNEKMQKGTEPVRDTESPTVRRVVFEAPPAENTGSAAEPEPIKSPVAESSCSQERSLLFESVDCSPTYQFGERELPKSQVFLRTFLTYAFIPDKQVAPGHVLVCPQHCVPKMAKLAKPEVTDLFQVVQLVQEQMEKLHGATASTVIVQDGVPPGQRGAKHVHVHIIPRKGEVDHLRLYEKLRDNEGESRSTEDLAKEAAAYREVFYAAGFGEVCRVRRRPKRSPSKAVKEEKKKKVPSSVSEDDQLPPEEAVADAPLRTGQSRLCKCIRCHRVKCPRCVLSKQTDVGDAAARIQRASPGRRRRRSPRKTKKTKRRGKRKGRRSLMSVTTSSLKDESIQGSFGSNRQEEGTRESNRSSPCQILAAGAFLGGAMIAVASVVKRLN